MKILYHHRTRATDAQRVHILEMVRAFRQLGHTVTIASLIDAESVPPEARQEAGEAWWKSTARHVPYFSDFVHLAYNAWALPWLIWKIVVQRPDFIYERYSLFTFAGVLAAAICRTPIMLEVNSPLVLEQSRGGAIKVVSLAYWMERAICNSATKVLAVTGALRRILIHEGVVPHKVAVITNGVNTAHIYSRNQPKELATRLGIAGRVTIGFVGWFRSWHGLDFLIRAFAGFGPAEGGAVLMLVGDGPAMLGLRGLVKEIGLESSVIFTGSVPHEQIREYLDLIDIAVQPAANEYCCPMKILEYMGLGKPIVAPQQNNIEELVHDGYEGLLFRPGDAGELCAALATLVCDAPLRSRMGEGALRAITERHLTWVDNASRVIDLLQPAFASSTIAVAPNRDLERLRPRK